MAEDINVVHVIHLICGQDGPIFCACVFVLIGCAGDYSLNLMDTRAVSYRMCAKCPSLCLRVRFLLSRCAIRSCILELHA